MGLETNKSVKSWQMELADLKNKHESIWSEITSLTKQVKDAQVSYDKTYEAMRDFLKKGDFLKSVEIANTFKKIIVSAGYGGDSVPFSIILHLKGEVALQFYDGSNHKRQVTFPTYCLLADDIFEAYRKYVEERTKVSIEGKKQLLSSIINEIHASQKRAEQLVNELRDLTA